jgi:hypothetical protein
MLEAAMPEETIFSIFMTAGQSSTINAYEVRVGKLVSTLIGTLNSGTLHLPPNTSDLIEEVQNYEVRISGRQR